jgi:anti-sigma regulatory factor (Ser/Thr protein kinase)
LARDIESPVEREFCLDRVTASAERLSEMVETALDVARIQAGHLELHPERVELQTLVSDAVGTSAPLGLPKAPPPPVEVDPKRLRQVLVELIRNAQRFAGKATRVSLDWREDGEFVELFVTVDDQGPGIPEDSLHKVFKPFMRLSATLDEGAGLGLTVSRAIAQGMDGDITLKNLPEGGLRATVQVRLPRLSVQGALVLAVGPDTPQWHQITDAVIGCEALLITATTAPEALRKARRDAFDFVLINAQVGGVAPELVARVIGDAQSGDCRIIAVGKVSDPSAFSANVGYSVEEVVAVIRPTSGESAG